MKIPRPYAEYIWRGVHTLAESAGVYKCGSYLWINKTTGPVLVGRGRGCLTITAGLVFLALACSRSSARPPAESASIEAAYASLRKGDSDTAAQQFQQLARAGQAAGHAGLGEVYALQGRWKAAIVELEKVKSGAPEWPDAATLLAIALACDGQLSAANQLAQQLQQSNPQGVFPTILLATIATDVSEREQALAALDGLAASSPARANAEYQIVRAELLRALGRPIAETNPSKTDTPVASVSISIALAEAAHRVNNLPLADALLAAAVRSAPKSGSARARWAEIAIERGDAVRAASLLEPLPQAEHEPAALTALRARIAIANGQAQQAATLLDRALADRALDAEARATLGRAHAHAMLAANRPDDARADLERLIAQNPRDERARLMLAELRIRTGQAKQAVAELGPWTANAEASARSHYWYGMALEKNGQAPNAEAAFQRAVDLDPNDAQAWLALGNVRVSLGQLGRAVAPLEQARKLQPKNVVVLARVADVYERTADYKLAAKRYEEVIAIDPRLVPALNNLAYLYAQHLGELTRAVELAKRAHDLAPELGPVADTYGWSLAKLDRNAEALPLLLVALEKSPQSALTLYHLGVVELRLGKAKSGRAHLAQALELSTTFEGANEARKLL